MARDGKREYLANVRLFSALNKRELGIIDRASDVVTVPSGTDIVTEGTIGEGFYLLLEGQVTVRRRGRKIATLGPGSYFGELSLLDRLPRSATVTADTDARLLAIGHREFLKVLRDVPGLAQKLLVSMAARLREADAKAYSH